MGEELQRPRREPGLPEVLGLLVVELRWMREQREHGDDARLKVLAATLRRSSGALDRAITRAVDIPFR